jgi:undecaprenol kinase
MKKIINSFRNALFGIGHVLKRHKNFQIMSVISVIVLLLGSLLDLSMIEWFFILWSITTVLILEMVNTAVEHVIDLIHKKKNIYAKLAKDIAAGAVLLSSLWAAIIGFAIFLPKIVTYIKEII